LENILINLTSDPSGLQPGIDSLVQMQVVDKELADQVKKTMEVYNTRNKATSDGLKKSSSDLETFSNNFKKVDKAIVGGAYNKALDDLKKQISGTGDEFKVLAATVDVAKKKLDTLKPGTTEWNELNKQISDSEILLKAFNQGQGETEQKSQSLKARLRELKNELTLLEDQGQDNTQKFEELSIEAAKLEDQIGDTQKRIRGLASDTANIDAVIQGVQLLASGFQLGAGAVALFGDENEDLQKALVKLNAIMAITNGIQQIQNSLQKENILILKAQAIGNSVLATSNEITAATFAAVGVSVEATSFAFKALRTAIITTGIGALVVGIGFLVEKISDWTTASKKAEEAQKRLAEATKAVNEAIIEQNGIYVEAISNTKESLEKQLALLQANGGSQLAQLSLRQKIAEEDKKIGEAALKNLDLTRTKLDLLTIQYDTGLQHILRLQTKIQNATDPAWIKALKTQVEIEQAKIDAIKPILDAGKQIIDQITKADTDTVTGVEETNKLITDKSLKSATALAEAKVLLARAGSKKELDAQIEAIRTAEQEQLHNTELTEGERVKISAQADKQIKDLRFQFSRNNLEDAKRGIDAQALLSKEGSQQELDFKLKSLQLGRDIELKDQALTANKKLEIEATYQKNREDLIKQYNQKIAENVLNAKVAETNAQISQLQLSADASTNQQLLTAKKKLLDEQAALEVLAVRNSIDTEENKATRIRAIYDKELADKKQLELQKKAAENQQSFDFTDALYKKNIAANKLIILDEKSTADQRAQAQQSLYAYQAGLVDNQRAKIEQDHADGLLSEEQYQTELLKLQTDSVEQQIALKQQLIEFEDQRKQKVLDISQKLFDGVFGLEQQHLQEELDRNQELYDHKLISEKEFNDRKKQIQKEEAANEKAKALFDIAIGLAKALFQIEAQAAVLAANPLTFALAPKALAQIPFLIGEAAIESALVLAQKFAKGGKIKGLGTDTSDNIPIMASPGEYVTKAAQVRKHEGVLRAINDDRYDQYLAKYELPKMYQAANVSLPSFTVPTISESKMQTIENHYHTTGSINYDKLADSIAKKLGEQIERLPQTGLSIDENGFTAYQRSQNDTINFKNKKLEL
jgi:hypothetical protein